MKKKKEQRCFPFSYTVNITLKNTLQEILCLEIVFIVSMLLAVATAKYLQPRAWGFSLVYYKLQRSERHNSCSLLLGIGSFLEMKCIKRRQNQLLCEKHGLCQEIKHLSSPEKKHRVIQGLTVFYKGSIKYFWCVVGR